MGTAHQHKAARRSRFESHGADLKQILRMIEERV